MNVFLHRVRRRRRRRDDADDAGFILLESMIAISLVTVVMSALGVFFLTSMTSSAHERARATAIQLATTTMDGLRSRDASSLIGTSAASVTDAVDAAALNAFASADPTAAKWLATMTPVAAPAVPAQIINGRTFTVKEYLGWCYTPTIDLGASCLLSDPTTSIRNLRVVVEINWHDSQCRAGCSYLQSTLINTDSDPNFALKSPLPPAPKLIVKDCPKYVVGDPVTEQFAVQPGTGVPPFTYQATGVPPGLTLSPAGQLTGRVTGADASPYTMSVTVLDYWQRADAHTFTCTVYPALALSDPGAPTGTVGTALSQSLSASGGDGGPYSFSITAGVLPPGLSLDSSSGTITGTPSTAGTYPLTVKVVDGSGHTATRTFTWTIAYPPLVAPSVPDQNDTVNTTNIAFQLSASGGSGNYAWSDPGSSLPSGLTINSAGLITGTAPGAVQDYPVALTVLDTATNVSRQVSFTWHILAAPTVGPVASQTTTVGASAYVAVPYSCPLTPCTLTVIGAPPGIGLAQSASSAPGSTLTVSATSGTVYLAGVVGDPGVSGTAATVESATVAITSPDKQSTSASSAWSVYAPPSTISGDGGASRSHRSTMTENEGVQVGYTCPNKPCTLTWTPSVPGIGLATTLLTGDQSSATTLSVSASSGGVWLTGTVSPTPSSPARYATTLSIQDAAGVTVGTSTVWVVYAAPTVTGLTNADPSMPDSEQLTYTCPVGSCTAAIAKGVSTEALYTDSSCSTTLSSTSPNITSTSGTFYVCGIFDAHTSHNLTITLTDVDKVFSSTSATVTAS